MLKEITCIVCPNGCEMEVEAENETLISVKGNLCPKGETYAKQELINPQRTISTSILIKGGELPLASVRLTKPVPKREIFHVMEEIKKISAEAPVHAGDVVIHQILGMDSDVIITKSVDVRK